MKTIVKNCEHCNIEFQASLKEHKRGNGRFCSLKCSANTIRKTSRSLKEHNCVCAECQTSFYRQPSHIKNAKVTGLQFCSKACKEKAHRIGGSIQPKHYDTCNLLYHEKQCEMCEKDFSTIRPKGKFCSVLCGINHKNKKARQFRSAFSNYRADCSFNFSIKDYPSEFDFKLIEKYGWYSAKNRGNNLGGVSRDHMVSVKYGFVNNIPAEYIKHPANCKLLIHNENVSKGSKISITYEELLERIKLWDAKYK